MIEIKGNRFQTDFYVKLNDICISLSKLKKFKNIINHIEMVNLIFL